MKHLHRMPSSIRIRRTESESNRNSFYSSADTYAGQDIADPQPSAATNADSLSAQTPTQGQSWNDYFTFRGLRRGSASTTTGEPSRNRLDHATPTNEVHRGQFASNGQDVDRGANNDDDGDGDESDNEILRREMHAARLAIHDQERREQRERSRRSNQPQGDYPPIRLSDESLHPRVPTRSTSRRPGAVEGLAMRHHRLHKEERRQKRNEQRSSVSTLSSQSSTSSPAQRAGLGDKVPRIDGPSEPLQPSHARNLSDVQEEGRSGRTTTSQNTPHAQGNTSSRPEPSNKDAIQSGNRGNRPRRNTTAEEGLMATPRRLYDTLLRRRSDRDLSNNDTEQRSALMRASQGSEDTSGDSVYAAESSGSSDIHEDEVVDYLDVVDPEVATVTTLQNVGNSIFFPPIPFLYNRRPTISLPSAPNRQADTTPKSTPHAERKPDDIELGLRPGSRPGADNSAKEGEAPKRPAFSTMDRVASMMPGFRKQQVPETTEEERRKHIKEWAEMDEEERNELDEHVHLLLTKKAKFKRAARGFWRYVKTPHGFIITTYAFLITFWGTAICLFLLRWINVGNPARQRYWIEICDQILCALFAAVGLGFAPFRAVDTYRMVQIAHYHFLTYKRRKELNLPELKDKNELPRAAPRLGVSQMTNTMMVRTGLRKAAAKTSEVGSDDDGRGAMPSEESRDTGDVRTDHNADRSPSSSWDVLDAVQSTQSACEVEELKEKRRNKHGFFRRKKRVENAAETDKKKQTECQNTAATAPDTSEPLHHVVVPKTYANKDGIIPLGQLKRNPSIASELPRDAEDVVVLSPKQQANLEYQQRKFHESHTFYRYRETVTHRPFELSLMMAIVILLDCHSCLQASLGGTTWGIYYKNRPTSVTATIITFSLSCNAVAGLLIWIGGNRTKKSEEVERLLRIALEEEALRKIKKRQRRRAEAERAAQRAVLDEDGAALAATKHRDFQQEEEQQGQQRQQATRAGGFAPEGPHTPALDCIHEH